MSFMELQDVIKEGDTVIVFKGRNSMLPLHVERGKILQTTYGAFPHNDLIGKKFGSKVYSKNAKGWVYLLHPTPELWTITLPHRTQILYTTDISMVILQLDIKPGAVVVESGTGSGSMSHSLIRAIAPHGHVYTFEFHEQRAEKAKMEFEEHDISKLVTIEHRDVIKDGFGLKHVADAVFLDLPSPWDALDAAKTALKIEGGRLCSFSPCMEQVQRTCETMRKLGFQDILVMENLLRTFDIKTIPMQEPYLGPKQEQQSPEMSEDEPPAKKSKLQPVEGSSEEIFQNCTEKESAESKEVTEESNNEGCKTENSTQAIKANYSNATKVTSEGFVKNAKAKQLENKINILTGRAYKEMPGHTGFLTFATLYSRPTQVDTEQTKDPCITSNPMSECTSD